MIDHVSTSQMELFAGNALTKAETDSISEHLMTCEACHQLFVEALRKQKDSTGLSFTISPESFLRHEHIEYEQLDGFAHNKLDATDRKIIDTHLSICASCREDVRSFLAFGNQLEPELRVRYEPARIEPQRKKAFWVDWWGGLAWKPIYAAAVVVIGIAIVIGATLLLKHRAENLQAQQEQTPQGSPSSTPDNRAANVPSPPDESAVEKSSSAEAIVVLNDRGATITVDKGGNLAGLDDVPAPTRDEIAKVLMSERLERPAILNELSGQEGSLRGSKNAQPFKLTYPSGTVILSDRPSFKWEKAAGASSYRVYVNDPAGHEVARSEELPSESTEWTVTTPLKRGEVYVWTVVALVDGKEIVSPGSASPEMKFQVLSTSSLRQLNTLMKTRSHLALGVFYAKVGLLDEAEHEFQQVIRLNPKSKTANKLLLSVRSLRIR